MLWFASAVIGYKDLYTPLHQEMVDFWRHPSQNKLGIWPRGHFKSSLFSVVGPLWELIQLLDPAKVLFPPKLPIQVLLVGENKDIPLKFTQLIRGHVERNQKLRTLFPELRPGRPWETKTLNFAREFDPILKESTIEIMGSGSNPTSPHYNLIVEDDLIGLTNYGTREGRDSAWLWHNATSPLMLPNARRVVTCTRWAEDDIAGRIISENEKKSGSAQYHIVQRGCFNEDGKPIFPTVWPPERLDGERISIGESLFALWYLNDPLDPKAAAFRPAWIKYWDEIPDGLEYIIVVDPASDSKETSDYSGMLLIGCRGNNRWVRKAEALHCSWNELAQLAREWSLQYQALRLGVEADSGQTPVMDYFEAEFRKGGLPKPMRLVSARTGGAKEYRIRALAPYLEYGCIQVHRSHRELIHELLHYPKTRNDDLVDALAWMATVMPFGALDLTQEKKTEILGRLKGASGNIIASIDTDIGKVPRWAGGWL